MTRARHVISDTKTCVSLCWLRQGGRVCALVSGRSASACRHPDRGPARQTGQLHGRGVAPSRGCLGRGAAQALQLSCRSAVLAANPAASAARRKARVCSRPAPPRTAAIARNPASPRVGGDLPWCWRQWLCSALAYAQVGRSPCSGGAWLGRLTRAFRAGSPLTKRAQRVFAPIWPPTAPHPLIFANTHSQWAGGGSYARTSSASALSGRKRRPLRRRSPAPRHQTTSRQAAASERGPLRPLS